MIAMIIWSWSVSSSQQTEVMDMSERKELHASLMLTVLAVCV